MRKIDALALGGTLFVPAVHKELEAVASGAKYPRLRSIVVDTEDGIAEAQLDTALERVEALLRNMVPGGPLRFLRPRNPEVLERLLRCEGIEKIDGFVLPKFGLENAERYLNAVGEHTFMPSIEGRELFDDAALAALRELLLPHSDRIVAIRFGAEDMLRQLGMRRECSRTLYDLCAPSRVIGGVLAAFKPWGFDVAAPVYPCYRDTEGFEAELRRDLTEGLVGKTLIHPDQIESVERIYRVAPEELEAAEALLKSEMAVFGSKGRMAETATQSGWAEIIMQRAEYFGMNGAI